VAVDFLEMTSEVGNKSEHGVSHQDVEVVTGGNNNGLRPGFNSNQCSSCPLQPAVGGTSPRPNPVPAVAALNGAKNALPWFITKDGPIREARFKRNPNGTPDGGVHDLFVITGPTEAVGCTIAQPNFRFAGTPLTGQGGNRNIIFRIPTPVFGAGLIEAIQDSAILGNMRADRSLKGRLGISGHPNAIISGTANRSENDRTITRLGWKTQNKSLLIFSGEACNVEMGVTNQLFPQERDETPGCLFNPTPADTVNFGTSPSTAVPSDIEAFADFMRMLAPPTPAPETPASAVAPSSSGPAARPVTRRCSPPERSPAVAHDAERRPLQPDGEPIFRSSPPPHEQRSCRWHHPGRCRFG
jgi:hypothetical protein